LSVFFGAGIPIWRVAKLIIDAGQSALDNSISTWLTCDMNVKLRQIEVDEETAALLEARAGARGMMVSELLADIACNQDVLPADLAEKRDKGEGPWSPEALEEDARRLADFERTREGVPWEEVKDWLRSWGTLNELPAPKPRQL
jgi:hypothetical protein